VRENDPQKFQDGQEDATRITKATLQGSDESLAYTVNMRRASSLSQIRDIIVAQKTDGSADLSYAKYENIATGSPGSKTPAGSLEDFHNNCGKFYAADSIGLILILSRVSQYLWN
jgi:hypothetical protein